MTKKSRENSAKKYRCDVCDYNCCYKSDLEKHLLTVKHARRILTNENSAKQFQCECGKFFHHSSSLWNHKSKGRCSVNDNRQLQDMKDLLKQQQCDFIEAQKQRDEVIKKQQQEEIQKITEQISNMSLVTNNNNTMNNKFNLNFFLNTQCKDAIDFQTFLQDHLQISQEDLFYFGNNGYVNGMMNIIDKSLGSIDVHKRPLHCTDIKRKIMYYKQGDGSWEKDEEKIHLKKLVKEIDNKTMDCLQNWEDGNRYKFEDMESQNFKWYFRVASETLGGDSSRDDQYMAKIMNHIVIETYVKKTNMLQNS